MGYDSANSCDGHTGSIQPGKNSTADTKHAPVSHLTTRRQALLSGAAMSIGIWGGCIGSLATPPPINQMEIRIADVRRPNFGATTATLTLIIEIENPSDSKIPSPTCEFDLLLNEEHILTSNASFNTLDPKEKSSERISAVLKYDELGEGILNVMRSGNFQIVLEGTLSSEGESVNFRLHRTIHGEG